METDIRTIMIDALELIRMATGVQIERLDVSWSNSVVGKNVVVGLEIGAIVGPCVT